MAGCPSVPPRLSAVGRGPGLGGAPLQLPPHSGGGSRHQVFPKPRGLPPPVIHSSISTSEIPLLGFFPSGVCDAIAEQGPPAQRALPPCGSACPLMPDLSGPLASQLVSVPSRQPELWEDRERWGFPA